MDLRQAAGFSLIEVLVALAISVMVVGIGLPAISDSLSRQADARSRISAVSLARSKIEEFTALTGRVDLPRSGIMNDLHWQVSVSEEASSGQSGIAASLMMERVVVEVLHDQGATPMISLTAFRLKRMTSP
jgi:prepilin-type N-terminal cleavage/methylation domain-containing protein